MIRIILYIAIISFGFVLSKYKIIPLKIKAKTGILQSFSLFFLLGVMGYKIGSDDKIVSEFPSLGFQALIIAIFSIFGSILITKLFFRTKKEGGIK
ncbi:LysO family transporter [uncultured Cetobacterium sp.]|uniref:LysO family transporter n=1 Tax=uncultured Cetobacterium sp. TaxID=527638 RepID=UPI002636321A|nr:LysO family transporter [uncultured Cetobacterium sp.]